MALTKEQVLDALGDILAYSVGRSQAVRNRVVGFTSEEDFDNYFRDNYLENDIQNLGSFWLCSTVEKTRPTSNPVIWGYIDPVKPSETVITNLVESLLKLKPHGKKIFLIEPANAERWHYNESGTPKITPEYLVRQYSINRGKISWHQNSDLEPFLSLFNMKNHNSKTLHKNWATEIKRNLSSFSLQSLLKLYADRYIIDFELTHLRRRGIPTDIDRVTYNNHTGRLTFLEIKEKDPSKGKIKGFGIDLARLKDIEFITENSGIQYTYIVRHVKDQKTREFVDWRYTSFSKYSDPKLANRRYEYEGKRGMLPGGANRMTRILSKGEFGSF